MKTKQLSICCLVSALLTGCAPRVPAPPVTVSNPSNEERVLFQKSIINSLKDPDSAKFGEQIFLVDNKAACVEVNAKNSYGGYTGFQQAMFVKVNGVGWKLMRIANARIQVRSATLSNLSG